MQTSSLEVMIPCGTVFKAFRSPGRLYQLVFTFWALHSLHHRRAQRLVRPFLSLVKPWLFWFTSLSCIYLNIASMRIYSMNIEKRNLNCGRSCLKLDICSTSHRMCSPYETIWAVFHFVFIKPSKTRDSPFKLLSAFYM